jgi:hypothetical protein
LARALVSMRRIFGSESGLDRLRMGLPNKYVKQRGNQLVALFLSLPEAFSGGGKFHSRHFFSYSSAGKST